MNAGCALSRMDLSARCPSPSHDQIISWILLLGGNMCCQCSARKNDVFHALQWDGHVER